MSIDSSARSNQDEEILAYLLGTLSDARKTEFEERYFTGDALFARLEMLEQDLVQDYLQGRLSPAQRKQFEKHYRASPHRWKRVQIAQALAEAQRGRPGFVSSTALGLRSQPAAAVLAVLLLVVSGVLVASLFKNRRLENQVTEYAAIVERNNAATPQQPAPASVVRLQFGVSDATRTGGTLGTSRQEVFTVPPGTETVEMTIALPDAKPDDVFTAVLLDSDERPRVSLHGLKPQTLNGPNRITATFAAAHLPQDSYIMRITNARGETFEVSFGIRVD